MAELGNLYFVLINEHSFFWCVIKLLALNTLLGRVFNFLYSELLGHACFSFITNLMSLLGKRSQQIDYFLIELKRAIHTVGIINLKNHCCFFQCVILLQGKHLTLDS